jgi:DNA-binding NarL/FixJ family response regulator
MPKFRILIADDHEAIRRGLRLLLESHADWELSGEAANGREAVEKSALLQPDLVITDLDMPELTGLEAIRQIRMRDPGSEVIVLTMYDTVELAAELRKAGAAAVIAKSEASERLVPAVHDAQRRRGWFGGAILARPRHAMTFFRTRAEADAELLPFIAEGVERGERIVHLVDARDAGGEAGAGIDVAAFDVVLRGETAFEHDAVLGHFAEVVRDSASRGFPLTRIIGETAWMMEHNPNFTELESRFNDLLADYDDVIVCAYDVTKFSAAMIVECMHAHPLVLTGGVFHQNPFFVGRVL